MATLPTLYPSTPDGTATTMAAPVGFATYAEAMQTNDGDTSYATSGVDSAGSVFVNIDDMPAVFESMDTLTVSCIVRLSGTLDNDTTQLYAQMFAADESTPLTDELLVTDQTTGSTYTLDSTAMTTVSPGDKTTWNGAKLRLRWTYSKSQGSDGIALRVTQAYLDGTYTAAPVSATLSSTATVATAALALSYGSVSMSSSSTASVSETIEIIGVASTSSSATFTSSSWAELFSTAALNGSSTLEAIPYEEIIYYNSSNIAYNDELYQGMIRYGSASLSGSAQASESSFVITYGSSPTSSTGSLTVNGFIDFAASSAMSSTALVSSTGFVEAVSDSAISSTASTTIAGEIEAYSTASTSAYSTLVSDGARVVNVAESLTASATISFAYTVLEVPQGITVTNVTESTVTLEWTTASGATFYEIERDGTIVGSTQLTNFTDSDLERNVNYTYRVRSLA